MNKQLVVFSIGAGEFAVDILTTKEVVPVRDITPVPETPDYVEGVMNLRGSLIPVLDLRKRLRAAERAVTGETRILISNFDGKPVGVLVDSASEVVRVAEEQIEPAPEILAEIGGAYVAGVAKLSDRAVTVIDLRKALGDEVVCELDELIEALQASRHSRVAPVQVAQL
jgi:purine-binding chemotaxis protein CheW